MLKLFGGFTCFELYTVGLNVQGNTINFLQYFVTNWTYKVLCEGGNRLRHFFVKKLCMNKTSKTTSFNYFNCNLKILPLWIKVWYDIRYNKEIIEMSC